MQRDRAIWRTSSYTAQQGNCVEVAVLWRKSSLSGQQGNCLEAARLPTGVGIRDTKHRSAGHLTVTPEDWRGFLATFTH